MAQFHNLDYVVIFVFFLGSILAGIIARGSSKKGSIDFLVAARSITLPAFIATTVSTFYGGILGVAEYSYTYGLSNWFVFGFPYYLYALIFALFLAKRVNQSRLLSIPDQLELSYGKRTAVIGAIFQFFTATPGAYLLMITMLLQMVFPISFTVALFLGLLISSIYIFSGGLKSIIYADVYLFICMFIGFILIVSLSFFKFGGLTFLMENVPKEHFHPTGGQPFTAIFVWYLIAITTLVEPTFYQRCFSAKSPSVAKQGMLYSILFWFLFDFLTTSSGLYAKAIFPNLTQPTQSFSYLANEVLPPVLKGLFWTAMFATVISTINSYTFVASVTIGRDFLWRIRNELLQDSKKEIYSVRYTQIGFFITIVVAIFIASTNESIVQIWLEFGSVFGPALVMPLLLSWSEKYRLSKNTSFYSMIFTSLVALSWTLTKRLSFFEGEYFLNLEPIYPALLLSLVFFGIDRLHKKYFTKFG